MRYSHQRNIIYQSICAVKTHPNAHEVIKMVQPYIPKISSGTVYRNLSQLVKNKMIKEINVNGISHYDGNIHDHQHFNCTECKSIIDYTVDSNSLINQFKKLTTHEAKECQVIFSGICRACQSTTNKEIVC